jgi:hypothetical protein
MTAIQSVMSHLVAIIAGKHRWRYDTVPIIAPSGLSETVDSAYISTENVRPESCQGYFYHVVNANHMQLWNLAQCS